MSACVFSVILLFRTTRFEANGRAKEPDTTLNRLAEGGLKTVRSKKLPLTSRAASRSQALAPAATPQLTASRSSYGVGAGDSAGDGEGDSVEPSVFGGVFLAAL